MVLRPVLRWAVFKFSFCIARFVICVDCDFFQGGETAPAAPTSKLEGIMEHVNRVKDIHIDMDLNLTEDDKGVVF